MTLRALSLLLALSLAACGGTAVTVPEGVTRDMMHGCDHFPGLQIDRVDPDGTGWVKQDNPESLKRFQECMAQKRLDAQRAKLATAPAREIVHRAYFTKEPPAGGRLETLPPVAAADFRTDDPVLFFLDLYKAGRARRVGFKWFGPDGTLAGEQTRVARDGPSTAERMWLTQALPEDAERVPGQWVLEVTIDNQSIGRFRFSLTQ